MLNEVFQKIWDQQNGGLDQYQLRDKAFAAIDSADYGDALHEALLNDAYAFMLSQRGVRAKTADAGQAPQAAVRDNAYAGRRTAGTANSARSSKAIMLRKKWPMLACSYSVAHGVRKNLESMSAEDCRASAAVSRALGDGNYRRADWLASIAEELITHEARVVAKLPAPTLTELQQAAP